MIPLFYLAKPKYGGWVSFTSHLYRSLQAIKCQPKLFKITKTNEKKGRHFADNIFYQNITVETALNLSEQFNCLITAQDKNFTTQTDSLLKKNTKIVIHDPNEMKDNFIDIIKKNNIQPVVIRESNYQNLKKLNIKSTYIKHPYLPFNNNKQIKNKLAVATSRIDFDKHTDLIIKANNLLNEKITIYGAENRLYTYNKLNKIDPNWRDNYKGVFDNKLGSVFKILNPSKFMLDMSAIKKDGGGSQYTFLEGWDANCIIILNKKWDLGKNNTMKHNYNCFYAENEKEIVELLKSNNQYEDIIENSLKELKLFNGVNIASEYQDVIKSK